jgi:hypothetical protein
VQQTKQKGENVKIMKLNTPQKVSNVWGRNHQRKLFVDFGNVEK